MKKIIFISLMVALLSCLMIIGISAETPSEYIEFGARFPGSDEYITVYTQDAEGKGNPRINFAEYKFYSDVDFTVEVDISTVTGIDFSVTKVYGSNTVVTRITNPKSPFVNCTEVKWFTQEKAMDYTVPSSLFNGWSNLKSFDFGNLQKLGDNAFQGCGFETLVIPSAITHLYSQTFGQNLKLTSVKFEGKTELAGNGNAFFGCTALTTVDLGNVPYIGKGTFKGCTALTSIVIPSSVTEIMESAFHSCSNLSSVTMYEGITKMGNYAFYRIGAASLHIPASVKSLGYQFAEESGIVSLTFAKNSQLTFIDHRAFQDCESLVGPVILPDGLIEIDYGLFNSCGKLKAVKMPDSVTTLSGNAALFSGCTSLEYVQFSNQITSICKAMFENCTSLKAISLPDSIQQIGYKALRNCTSLEAVYLPSGLTNLGQVDNGATDWGVFYQSPKVYFVQEPFNVFDGDKLVENFEMPSKPEVYYMPSGLVSVGNSEFQGCNNLNDVIVFPEGVTTLDGCKQGAFFGAGKGRTSAMTLVFLGDMSSIIIRQNDDSYANIHYVFANPNDVDLNSLTLTIGSANNRYLVNSFMYFCKGNVVYDLSTFKAANSTVYTVLETDFAKTVNTAEAQPHFANPRETIYTDPTCVDNKKELNYCFCGYEMGVKETENTSLGHDHSIYVGLVYQSYLEEGVYSYKCERCDDLNGDEKAPALFVCKGYSVSQIGTNGISLGFEVNKEAIANYTEKTGKTIKYGVFAGSQSFLGSTDLFDEGLSDKVIKTEIARVDFAGFDIKIVGFTDANMNSSLAMGAYVAVTDGEETTYSYMQASTPTEGEKYCYDTFSNILAKLN